MGTTKQQNFDLEINEIAQICKALGHPTRLQILSLLLQKNNRNCGEVVALIPLAQSTISKHLLELKKTGLINIKNQGKKTIYSLEVEKMKTLKKYITLFISNKTFTNEINSLTASLTNKENKLNLKKHNYQFPTKIKDAD
jgi:ArsR family transcriptional regulator